MKRLLFIASVIFLMAGCGASKTEAEKFADDLLAKMTLREKLGQMSQFRPRSGVVTGPEGFSYNLEDMIKAGEVGSILSLRELEYFEIYQRLAVDSSRLGIPILFAHDIIHGCKVIFPINLGSSCTWDVEATKQSARVAAVEASAMGLAWTFSPMCDISADPRWGRVSEGSGEDPYLAAKLSAAMVEGYQGDDLSDSTTILACVKHFAAYGAPEAGREYNTVDMSERMFRDRYLPVYQAALEAGAATVMSAFNDFDGIPASGNKWLLKDVLRDELGFDGFVVSDYDAVHEMVNHGVAADGADAARLALEAYLDMEMTSGDYINHGEELVRDGIISEKHIDMLCRNILIAKYELGLFEDPFRYGGAERFARETYKPESIALARKIARESMVLLKNDDSVLPLKEGQKIAMIGPFLSDARAMNGTWDGFSEAGRTVTIEQGMKARFPKGSMTFTRGCDAYNHISGGVEAAVRAARAADVAVLTLGLPGNHSGETSSMTSVELPQAQKELLAAVKATGKPVVVLLVTGRAMALESVDALMDGLLVVWHPGTAGGDALADLLSGDYSPSGHLTMSFPRCDGQIPIRYNYKSTGRPINKEIDYTQSHKAKKNYLSSYLFTPNTPLYSFGYGLSYTEFSFSDLEVLNPEVALGEDVTIKVRVSNVGEVEGTTVAQLYMRDMVASTTRPVRELKGFERVTLKPGESTEVEFVLTAGDMSFCREDMQFAQEPGEFGIWVGESCEAELSTSFVVKE